MNNFHLFAESSFVVNYFSHGLGKSAKVNSRTVHLEYLEVHLHLQDISLSSGR